MTKAIITINGRTYDAITGMPVAKPQAQVNAAQPHGHHTAKPPVAAHKPVRAMADVAPAAHAARHHAPAQAIHQVTQKPHTLYRAALKKPAVAHVAAKGQAAVAMPAAPAAQPVAPKPVQTPAAAPAPAVQHRQHERSPLISRFGSDMKMPAARQEQPAPKPAEHIAPAAVHPAVAKVLQQQAAAQPVPQLSGSDLKEQLIKERLAEVSDRPTHHEKKHGWLSRQPRLVTILSSTLALLILGGYLTYITLPSISLRVAASRAGVNANMPEYKPDGYSLDGPITYSPGEVVISYKSNGDEETGYKLVQKATNWDSQAVLDNYVAKLTDNYLTFQERGITVYTFGNKAAWVNGGLLYTIEGNAALSSDQILKVAASI